MTDNWSHLEPSLVVFTSRKCPKGGAAPTAAAGSSLGGGSGSSSGICDHGGGDDNDGDGGGRVAWWSHSESQWSEPFRLAPTDEETCKPAQSHRLLR